MIDVLIAGAGPTGLTLAILCNRLGLSYRIIDRNSGPVTESKALGIQARTLELFDKLGFVDEFLKRGIRAKGVKFFLKGKLRLEIKKGDMAREDTKYPYVLFLPQSETEKILLREVSVERCSKLTSFIDKKKYVLVSIINSHGDREDIQTRFLCGCDGSHSMVRKGMRLDLEGDAYATEFLMADCKVDWKEDYNFLKVFLESGHMGAFFPIKGASLSRVLTLSKTKKEGTTETQTATSYPASLGELENEFIKASQMNVNFSEPKWITRYHVHRKSVNRMREGNVFVLGDAAHLYGPVGALGMNTGIQDANNLAWKLKEALTNPQYSHELLETFNEERVPVAKHLIHFTDRIYSAVVGQSDWIKRARNLIIPVIGKTIMHFPKGKSRLFKFLSQLNIHYHPNLITKEQTGQRAPDGEIRRGLSLHDLLKGYEFHAIAFKKDAFNKHLVDSIYKNMHQLGIKNVHLLRMEQEEDGYSLRVPLALFQAYHVDEQSLFIIRPDGYIGCCSTELELEPDYPLLKVDKTHDKSEQTNSYM